MKTTLTKREFSQIMILVCEATLHEDAEIKQYNLIEIGGIMVGSKNKFIESAENLGYNISKGLKP